MTDFFTRLAARTLGLAPTVQPLIAPLYAPEPYQTDTEAELTDLVMEERSDKKTRTALSLENKKQSSALPPLSQEQIEPTALPHHSRPVEEVLSVPTVLTTQQEGQQPAPIQQESQHPAQIGYTQSTFPPLPPVNTGAGIQHDTRNIAAEESRERIVQNSTVLTSTTTINMEMGPSEDGTKRQEKPASAQPLPEIVRTVVLPSPDTHPIQRAVEREIIKTIPVGKRVQRTAEQATQIPEAAIPAPTVHVTIGRIEVRATQAPVQTTQSSRPKAAPTVMSLDDYLLQRTKGDRP